MRTEAAQLRLLTWFSPAFPVGAFGYSHGLETAIREGWIADAAGLREWIETLMEQGSGWSDAVLFRAAWGAADTGDLGELIDLALALAPAAERQLESVRQGAAFLAAVRPWMLPLWGSSREAGEGAFPPDTSAGAPSPLRGPPPPSRLAARPPSLREPPPEGVDWGEDLAPYPIAAGQACNKAGLPLEASLTAWVHGFAANLVSVGVRAIPIGQSEAVAVLAALEPIVLQTVARAAGSTLDDLGAFALRSDIAAMRHETLQPRLFIT